MAFAFRRLLLFSLIISALLALTTASALELTGGWESIAITEDMAGKSFSQAQIKGDCNVQQAWGVYDTKKQPSKTEGQWIRLHWQDDSRTITDEMIGYGLVIYTPAGKKCSLKTKGYAENLGKVSRLASGWNFISVSKGMVGKSLAELPLRGACEVEKVRLYSPEYCKYCEAAKDAPELSEEQRAKACETPCDGDFSIIDPATPLSDSYLGKGIWVKVTSGCILDDGTPSEVLCSERECSAKSSCRENKYVIYGCSNKECVEVSRSECPAEEEPAASVNLVPELVISPAENIRGGDAIKVTLYIKNTGNKAAHYSDMVSGGTSINNIIHFYKGQEYGSRPVPLVSAPISLLTLPDGAIKPGDAGRVRAAERSVKLPEDFLGNLVVVAVVDVQSAYPESPESAEDDNKQRKLVTVGAAGQPDLVVTEAEASPSLETIPVTVLNVIFKVQNLGEKPAVAEEQFLAYKVSITKGNDEVCKGYKSGTETIMPNEVKSHAVEVKSASGSPCLIDDKQANYWAIVEADAVGTGKPRGAVLESDETNNKRSFQIKGPQTCTPHGAREAGEGGKYCSIATGTWLTQKADGERCSHNFECKTDLCVCTTQSEPCPEKKCVSAEKKKQVIETVWK